MQQRRIWRAKPFQARAAAELSVETGVSPLLAQLLLNRGISTPDDAIAFLHPSYCHVHDPMRLPNMPAAVERLKRALDANEKIVIYGDYDVDGTTATALLIGVLRRLGGDADYYLPDRQAEGYGMNVEAMRTIKEQGAELLLTVDCGVTAAEPIAEAHRLGLDVIVTDHHAVDPDRLPSPETVVALIDPQLEGHDYPFRELAGVGLAFKLAHALVGGEMEGGDPTLLSQLDLVALGTIADMADLSDENRALAKIGLEAMSRRERPGIRALCEVAGIDADAPLTGHHVGYVLGPRINAAGRLDTGHKVVELLTTDSDIEALGIAQKLNEENQARRSIERAMTDEATEIIQAERRLDQDAAILVAREGWHPGVVGIVASRLVERFWRPTVVIALDGDLGRGSARSIPEFHIQQGLLKCRDWMVTFGGHAAAAGLTVTADQVEPLRNAFMNVARDRLTARDLIPKLNLDMIAPLGELSLSAIEELALLEPCGEGNPPVRVGVRGLGVVGSPRLMGRDRQHLSATLTDGQRRIRVVGWNAPEYAIPLKTPGAEVDVAGRVEINEYKDRRNVQLTARDWVIHPQGAPVERGIYPAREHPTWVKIVDNRRRKEKGAYLQRIIRRDEPTLIYVRDDRAVEQARDLLAQLGIHDSIGYCVGEMDEEDRGDMVAALLRRECRALVSHASLTRCATVDQWSTLRHILFCHPPTDDEAFLERSEPALAAWGDGEPGDPQTRYVHLLFHEQDLDATSRLSRATRPDEDALRTVYRALAQHREPITEETWLDGLDDKTKRALDRAKSVFEELDLFERVADDVIRFKAKGGARRELNESPTYRRDRIERLAWEIQARLWSKRTARDFWDMLMRRRQERADDELG